MTTVLVVDDEALIVMALEAVLEDEGYRVLTASNGRQGLDQLATEPRPDVVLLDMMMPVMGGAAMLRAMAEDPALRRIPVVVMSSLPEKTLRQQADGAAAVVRKPYTAEEVLAAVTRVLGCEESRRDAGNQQTGA
jgi:CheY-like chemotaxis protein